MRLDLANIIVKKQGNKRCSSAGGSTRVPAGAVTSLSELSENNKRCSSAGRLSSSTVGAVNSLILMRSNKHNNSIEGSSSLIGAIVMFIMFVMGCGLFGVIGLFGLFGSNKVYADTLSVTIDNPNLVLNLVPTSSTGTFSKSENMNIAVTTDNSVGYTLSFAATNGTSLVNGDNSISSIGSVSGVTASGISESDFSSSSNTKYNNTWGYKPSQIASGSFDDGDYTNTANSNYLPLPTSSTPQVLAITDSANPSTANNYTISIGARINGDTPPGSYASDTFNITAVANVVPIIMQEITDAECRTLASDSPLKVLDARDGNDYTVRWINGQCWMTQNLNLAGGTMLSSEKTDFPADYSLPTTQGWQSDGRLPASSNSGFSNDNYAYIYNSNSTTCNASASSPSCYSYYSWDAATLGSGRNMETDNTNAPYSICPKGWHLPSTRNGVDSSSDYRALMIALGATESVQAWNSSTTPTATQISNKLLNPPYSFNIAGVMDSGSFVTGRSRYWSSTVGTSNTTARHLNIATSYIGAADSNNRRLGGSIRCVYGK